ncbi:MAG: glycosyltransferase family 4 protein [Ruminococcaceae bacterium]|nr:glycosyltransferase family 4 protein [Oscillospiraceae bacterium]
MKKILILVNDVTTVLQFRCELVRALVAEGHEVTVSVPKSDRIPEIEALGAKVVETEVARHGKNPMQDLKLLKNYKKLLRALKPDIALSFTIKPNVYGGMACGSLKIPYVANVTGLGVVGDGGIMQKLMLWLYKNGLKKAKCVFFQNQANEKFFREKKVVSGKTELLPGSGVNVEKFSFVDYPEERTTNIVFVGRIIKDKGVFELAEAAKRLQNNSDLKFTVVGDVEYGAENPFTELPNVECVGFHKDVKPYLKDAHAIVLPSYHEGMANVLLEAAASGRPILASDIPGCTETFDEGVTGFGFKAKDVDSLTGAIEKFVALPYEEKREMGKAGRNKIENEFNRKIVVDKYLHQVNSLE